MKLVYKIGRERGEIVEKQDFNESIFAEQYVRALSFVSKFVDSKEISNNLNVIAFCGDRGEGKSSCMRTVLNMLVPDANTNIKIYQMEANPSAFRLTAKREMDYTLNDYIELFSNLHTNKQQRKRLVIKQLCLSV